MASISMAKFKALLPFTGAEHLNGGSRKSKRFLEQLDPEVGFEMSLVPSQPRKDSDKTLNGGQVSELHVKILGARHLPSLFGMKTVEGYVVKVKVSLSSI